MKHKTVDCRYCGKKTYFIHSEICDECWEKIIIANKDELSEMKKGELNEENKITDF